MLSIETKIREAKEQDLPFIVEVYNKNILESTSTFRYAPVTLEERMGWLDNKRKENLAVLVAEKENVLQGFASYAPFRAGEGYQYTVEHSIYVAAEHQKQGIAKFLLQALIQIAKNNKIHTMVAGIDTSNAASHRLHQTLGFQACGSLPEVGRKFDQWLDLTFYCLTID